MVEWIESTMNSLGYPGITVLMVIETIVPFVPSEIVMPMAGFSSSQGNLWWVGAVLAGLVGSMLGLLPMYYLGRVVGEARIKRWADKYGKWLTISSDDIENAKGWLVKHGSKVVILSHLLPGVRSLIAIPAGIIEMNVLKFLLFSAIGKGIWITILTYAGRLLGENYGKVREYLAPASFLVIGVIVVGVIIWIWRRKNADDQSEQPDPETAA